MRMSLPIGMKAFIHRHKYNFVLLALAGFALLTILIFSNFIPKPKSLTVFHGRSSSIKIVVFDSSIQQSVLKFQRVVLINPENGMRYCLKDAMVKGILSDVSILRDHPSGTIFIDADAGADVIIESQRQNFKFSTGDDINLSLEGRGSNCFKDQRIIMPVESRLEIGEEFNGSDYRLEEGQLVVYGRSKLNFLNFLYFDNRDRSNAVIYEAGTLNLPSGSRIGNNLELKSDDAASRWGWQCDFGTKRIRNRNEDGVSNPG